MSGFKSLEKDFSNLNEILRPYIEALEGVAENIAIEGKTLEKANLEQPVWHAYYDERRVELKSLSEFIKMQVQRFRAIQTKKYTENYSYDLPERTKEKYIDKDDAYLDVNETYLEVYELYTKFDSIVEAYKSRGFALRNITNARVAALQDTVL